MSVLFKDVNFSKLVDKLTPCCLSEEVCGSCEKEKCIVAYAKECIKSCMINKVTFVENGREEIPSTDFKVYEREFLLDGIVETLKACKSCTEEHFDNCIISILRNSYEIALLGEEQEYQGSTFLYLNKLKEMNNNVADKIFEKYNSK
ncbi:hypothetical protein [Clostridium sp.]|uniref:hypothetical protein n=1 Tax=Clostridium sp. TaxID=1506 RepID=UPI002846C4FA|nr:hypothetical protein [Clostridium sp.]MDR3596910.1 hypothetical protein [Clostridium sp.]